MWVYKKGQASKTLETMFHKSYKAWLNSQNVLISEGGLALICSHHLEKLQIKQDFIIQITCPDTDPSLIPDANGATLIVGCDALQRSEPSRTKMAAVKSGLFSFTCLEMTLLYHCHIEKTFIWSYTEWYWLKEWLVWDVTFTQALYLTTIFRCVCFTWEFPFLRYFIFCTLFPFWGKYCTLTSLL